MKVKRFIAILLAVVLVLGLIPLTSVGGGVAYAAPEVPRVTTFSIANGTEIHDNSSNAVVGTVNGVEMFQRAAVLNQTMTGDWESDFYDIGEIRIYYTADSEITSPAKIGGVQYEFANNGYPNALLNEEYSSITYYCEGDYVVIGADEDFSACFAYELSLIREPAPPRVTTFSIANGTEIHDNSSNAVVGTVNGVEMFQRAAVLNQTMTGDWGSDFYDIGEIRIYYTADSEITSPAKIGGVQCEFANNGYPNALLNEDYSSITYWCEGDYVVIGADEDYSAFFAYELSLIQGSVDDADTTAPTLEVSGVTRTSASAATILFNADEGGEYFYSYGSLGDEITIDTANAGHTMVEGENTLELSGLTDGAKVLRILAKDAADNMMEQSLEVVIPAYSTTAAEWPQLISFLLPDGKWSVSNGVKSVELTADNVRIEQYSQLLPYAGDDSANAYYAGMVILDCKDTCITEPSEEAGTLRGWNGYAQFPAGFKNVTVVKAGLSLYKGASELKITASKADATYTYYYKVCIVGNDMLYSVPNTWTLNKTGDTFTFKPGKYLSSYAKWNTTNQVVPTWGTTLNKTFLDFTNGSDTFTLTNSVGTTKTYTVNLEMPWQLFVPGDPGYNVSFIKSGDKVLAQDIALKNNKAYTLTKEVAPDSTVTMAIKPYGDNAGKVIDTITLTNADEKNPIIYSDIPINTSGNTFSFTMPSKNVRVASVTFKEDTSPRYTITATASKHRSDNGDMGTVKVTDVNGAGIGDAHAGNDITVTAAPVEHGGYTFKFVGWEAEGITLTEEQKTSDTITFEMPAANVSLNAVFEKVGAELTFSADPENALKLLQPLSNTQKSPMSLDFSTTKKDIVKPGATIRVWPIENDQFVLESYTIKDQDNATIEYTSEGTWCEFTVPENATSVHVTANYRAKEFSEITTAVNDKTMGSATATVNGTPISAAVTEGETVTLTATPKFRYKFDSWTVTYADGSKIDFGLTSAEGTPNVATFKVPANGKKIYITANFVRDKTQNSAECEMRSVGLYNGETKIGKLSKSGTNYTITVPADTDTGKLGEMLLKLTCSDHATVKKFGEKDPWPAEGKACGMTLDTPATFVVTAEDGTTTKTYTITIKQEAAPDAPTLSAGSATRTGKNSATVTFTSSEAGSYYYKLVTKGAAAPTIDTTGSGTAASAGSNTITLTNLTEDARDIYIVVKNANVATSDALKVDIPAYGDSTVPDTGAYSITYSGPKGGKLVPSRTKADEGDTITVTAVPDSGYQMVAGSMTYTLAVSGGTTTKITGNQFTMPEGDVTLSCQWETATATTTSGITAFTINGVSAAVNNTTNVITITLPRGTDVTKLSPVISTSGVKSLSPASGKTVDFTNSVTYTAAMDDGSTKTYTVTVYVDKGSLADQFWDKLTDFYNQTPWWQYAEHQQSTKKYPKYW